MSGEENYSKFCPVCNRDTIKIPYNELLTNTCPGCRGFSRAIAFMIKGVEEASESVNQVKAEENENTAESVNTKPVPVDGEIRETKLRCTPPCDHVFTFKQTWDANSCTWQPAVIASPVHTCYYRMNKGEADAFVKRMCPFIPKNATVPEFEHDDTLVIDFQQDDGRRKTFERFYVVKTRSKEAQELRNADDGKSFALIRGDMLVKHVTAGAAVIPPVVIKNGSQGFVTLKVRNRHGDFKNLEFLIDTGCSLTTLKASDVPPGTSISDIAVTLGTANGVACAYWCDVQVLIGENVLGGPVLRSESSLLNMLGMDIITLCGMSVKDGVISLGE